MAYEPEPENPDYGLWTIDESGGLERIDLPQESECFRTRYRLPTALSADRLAFVRECVPAAGQSLHEVAELGEDGEVVPLGQLPSRAEQFVWLESEGRGLAGVGSAICQTLAWFGPAGSEGVDLVIEDDAGSFNLADQFKAGFGEDCPMHGRADSPTASPDGSRIAFFASPQSIGTPGQARLDAPWNLYVADVGGMSATMILEDVSEPGDLRWSPVDDRLVFSGELAGHGIGTWVLSEAEPTPRRISPDRLALLAWAPDATSIAGILLTTPDQFPPLGEIVVLDMTNG